MPKIANVTINNQRSEGSIGEGSKKADTEIIKQLKKLNDNFSKMIGNQKTSSIFGGGKGGGKDGDSLLDSLMGGGILSKIIKLIGGGGIAGAGIIAGTGGLLSGGSAMQTVGYEKALIEGEEKIVAINNLTGEIIKVMTFKEAMEKNIVDETGKMSFTVMRGNHLWEKSIEGLKFYKDMVELSVDQLDKLISAESRQKELQDAINNALTKKLKRLGADVPSTGPARSYSSEIGIGFDDSGRGYSAASQITNRETMPDPFQPYDAWWKQSDSKFVSSMYKSP